jgi:hypothetical protein
MNSITRFPKNKEEVNDAIELICRSFPASYKELKLRQSSWLKCIPKDFKFKNFILAIKDDVVVGAFHVSERFLIVGNIKTKILATTDFCIDKSVVNDPNFGARFFEEGLNILKKTNNSLIIGSARKKLENFYYWYGFASCNSYSTVEIEKIDYSVLNTNGKIKENFNAKLISLYEKLRRNILSSEWNYFLRKKNFWNYIQKYFINKKKFKFIEIYNENKIIGFSIIKKDNEILDFGYVKNKEDLFFGTLFKYLSKKKNKITLNISPENNIFHKLGLIHLHYSSRRIPNEGYVAKILNSKIFIDLFCKVFEKNYSSSDKKIIKIFKFHTSGLRFKLVKNRKLIPLFDIEKLNKLSQIELLNILFFGINNRFSIYKLKNFKNKKENYFNILETDFI